MSNINSTTRMEYNTFKEAYFSLQHTLEPVKKNVENNFYNSTYADLVGVRRHADPILKDHGFYVIQTTKAEWTETAHRTILITELRHRSFDDVIVSSWEVKPKSEDPQAYGSALTYAKRYQYMLVTGLVAEDEDDDGNAASVAPKTKKKASTETFDSRPWLTEEQKVAMIKAIYEGKSELVRERMKGYKMKKVYREELETALKDA